MNNLKTYKNSLTDAMTDIAKIDNSFFIGQGVLEGGHGISPTLEQINDKKKNRTPSF